MLLRQSYVTSLCLHTKTLWKHFHSTHHIENEPSSLKIVLLTLCLIYSKHKFQLCICAESRPYIKSICISEEYIYIYISLPRTLHPSIFPQDQSTLPDRPPRLLLLPLSLPRLLFGHLSSLPLLLPHSPFIRFAFLSLLRWLYT